MIKAMGTWRGMCKANMPVLHIFQSSKIIVISVSQGTVIRPMRTVMCNRKFVMEGPFVDMIAVYHSDMMSFCKLKFPRKEVEPLQYFNIAVLLMLFIAWTVEPRPNLGLQMMRQSMSAFAIRGNATFVSLVMTDFGDTITSRALTSAALKIGLDLPVPRKPVMTAFISRSLNTEDACSVSEEWANSRAMASWPGTGS